MNMSTAARTIVLLCLFIPVCYSQTATTLSSLQIEEINAVKARAETRAKQPALQMAATIRRIYANMLSPHEDQRLRHTLSEQLHRDAGKLLDIKGQSFRESLAILTPEQRTTILTALNQPDAPQDIGELIEKTFKLNK